MSVEEVGLTRNGTYQLGVRSTLPKRGLPNASSRAELIGHWEKVIGSETFRS
jgi:hypothetical protein